MSWRNILCAIQHHTKTTRALLRQAFGARADDRGLPIGLLRIESTLRLPATGDISPGLVITRESGHCTSGGYRNTATFGLFSFDHPKGANGFRPRLSLLCKC